MMCSVVNRTEQLFDCPFKPTKTENEITNLRCLNTNNDNLALILHVATIVPEDFI